MSSDKKINVTDLTDRKIQIICLTKGINKKQFIELLIDKYIEKNPIPQTFKINKNYEYEF